MENGHLAVGTNVSESGGLQAFVGALGPDQPPIVAGAFNDPNLLILPFRFEQIRRRAAGSSSGSQLPVTRQDRILAPSWLDSRTARLADEVLNCYIQVDRSSLTNSGVIPGSRYLRTVPKVLHRYDRAKLTLVRLIHRIL
ncbi:MAG: hypothetical protein DMG45_22780 [Acidobacteria bacterium]|nr:MAG: hypothetical protein DMG45_22780 [Acidobacteriota bacterium]